MFQNMQSRAYFYWNEMHLLAVERATRPSNSMGSPRRCYLCGIYIDIQHDLQKHKQQSTKYKYTITLSGHRLESNIRYTFTKLTNNDVFVADTPVCIHLGHVNADPTGTLESNCVIPMLADHQAPYDKRAVNYEITVTNDVCKYHHCVN